ncbi:MAG: orotidine-5'-phosphate decarboxylase [Candidatus Schekmanbacteria bacterium]|nr:MAG: orotidine-5'-phosphate decarboxylase [Candidatus Schekmanbacteria bacterium]
MSASEKLIFALDVDGYEEAMKWVKKLKDYVRVFKVGKQLFTACGPNIVKEILKNDCKVFLDLKFHDIPNTVSSAVIETAKLGVSIITIHASGGRKMIEKTRKDVDEFCAEKGIPVPLIAAVTVLTSISEEDLAEIGVGFTAKEQVLRLAKLSLESGADAIVCSPLEISFLRNSLGNNFKIIAPGIRDRGTKDDQKRVMSASDAIKAGADYIVVGRPIRNAPDPISAAEKIIGEIAGSN